MGKLSLPTSVLGVAGRAGTLEQSLLLFPTEALHSTCVNKVQSPVPQFLNWAYAQSLQHHCDLVTLAVSQCFGALLANGYDDFCQGWGVQMLGYVRSCFPTAGCSYCIVLQLKRILCWQLRYRQLVRSFFLSFLPAGLSLCDAFVLAGDWSLR